MKAHGPNSHPLADEWKIAEGQDRASWSKFRERSSACARPGNHCKRAWDARFNKRPNPPLSACTSWCQDILSGCQLIRPDMQAFMHAIRALLLMAMRQRDPKPSWDPDQPWAEEIRPIGVNSREAPTTACDSVNDL